MLTVAQKYSEIDRKKREKEKKERERERAEREIERAESKKTSSLSFDIRFWLDDNT